MPATPTAPEGFALTKWYLDCVDADGRAVIGYWASIRLGSLELTWHSVAVYEPGQPPRERMSLHQVPAPERRGATMTWQSSALDCSFTFEARLPAASIRLLNDQRGRIEWRCEMPGALAHVTTADGSVMRGAGYAECLVMTVLPWRLPIDELRWGRWLSADARRSVVWIDWRGESPGTWVLVDGIRRHGATVRDDGVAVGNAGLTLRDTRTLHERSLSDIVGSIKPLVRLVPKRLLALREHKVCSTGSWRDGEAPTATGWSIHELVRFQ